MFLGNLTSQKLCILNSKSTKLVYVDRSYVMVDGLIFTIYFILLYNWILIISYKNYIFLFIYSSFILSHAKIHKIYHSTHKEEQNKKTNIPWTKMQLTIIKEFFLLFYIFEFLLLLIILYIQNLLKILHKMDSKNNRFWRCIKMQSLFESWNMKSQKKSVI